MPESRDHMNYVLVIKEYVNNLISEDEKPLLSFDSPDSKRPAKIMNNYIPDLFFSSNSKMIIGEAKTELDFETRHSIKQYESYIEECKMFEGESILVICVSMYSYAAMKNLLRGIKRKSQYCGKIIVMDTIKRVSEI